MNYTKVDLLVVVYKLRIVKAGPHRLSALQRLLTCVIHLVLLRFKSIWVLLGDTEPDFIESDYYLEDTHPLFHLDFSSCS